MKILNLYAGIGGNRKLWGDEHEIVAVENDPEKIKLETRQEKIEEKQELHKWTWNFEHNVNYSIMSADGWKSVCIGFYKVTKTPEQGESFGRKDYKGFIIRFSYWFPIRFN